MQAKNPFAIQTSRQWFDLLKWPLAIALIFGFLQLASPLEDLLRIIRNVTHLHKTSGDIVLVKYDEKSIKLANWPWPRSKQAQLLDVVSRANPKRVVFDLTYIGSTKPEDDNAFSEALRHSGKVTLGTTIGAYGKTRDFNGLPIPQFAKYSKLASIGIVTNWQAIGWSLQKSYLFKGKKIPSLSASLAGIENDLDGSYRVDYSIDALTVPQISAVDVLAGKFDPSLFRGKTVVFGTSSDLIGDQYSVPGRGKLGGVFVHIIGAETLIAGPPIDMGWIPGLILALVICFVGAKFRRSLIFGGGSLALVILAGILEARLVFIDIMPGLALIVFVVVKLARARAKERGLINALTGLSNLASLASDNSNAGLPLIAMRLHNFAEIASTLDEAGEKLFVSQLVSRININGTNRIIYQGDKGIFAWFIERDIDFEEYLEVLYATVSSPIRVNLINYDIALSFGIEIGSDRLPASRLGSALVAAEDAERESLKWKFHDPARLQEVPWRLSLLSQMDLAIDVGQVWFAYQPKLDLKTRRTIGAEALARWTHPERGEIQPMEFVTAAEQADRIGKLTDFSLNQAISAAANLTRQGFDFGIAVNLSARCLTDRNLPDQVLAILEKNNYPADKLTLELTETSAISSALGVSLLEQVRNLGIRISIDDYGTGLSTLEYLKKIPANEIKIDQGFIMNMRNNPSDLIMVRSTISLAHSLGRTVVAEGIEDPETLKQLSEMGCDIAQGYIVGRPMTFDDLLRRLKSERKRNAL